mgnify:FL=1
MRVFLLCGLVFAGCFLLGILRLEPWIGFPLAGAIACSFLRKVVPSVFGVTACVAVGELAFGLAPGAWALGAGLSALVLRQLMRQGPPDWTDCLVACLPLTIFGLLTSFVMSFLSAIPPTLPSLLSATSFLVSGVLLSRPVAFYVLGEDAQRSWS